MTTVGCVYWVTGLSGAGKTTIAQRLRDQLWQDRLPIVLLDGDRLRSILAPQAGYSPDERRALAFTYARLCRELADQGLVVICATVSMFHDVRDWNRANISGYREIYLRVPLDVRRARDTRGLYRSAASAPFGVDGVFEEPRGPNLTIDNDENMSPAQAVELILAKRWSS
jgi:cytidine diphosphoramidate kinase